MTNLTSTQKLKKAKIIPNLSQSFHSSGGRKSAMARVWVLKGTGTVIINKHLAKDYFHTQTLVDEATLPLKLVDASNNVDVVVNVNGGGLSGQAGAIQHALSLALRKMRPDYGKILRENGTITRDARVVESKKYGFRKARRKRQFSKR